MNLEKLEFVKSQLGHYTGPKKNLSDSTFVLCPSHSEKTPSFRIFHTANSNSPGWGKCYGCGFSAPWDQFAKDLGLEQYKWSKPSPKYALPLVRNDQEDSKVDLKFKPLPKNKIWRQINTNLLRSIGCKLIDQYGEKLIYMPVIIKGEERGYIRARLRKAKDKPSYLNSKGKWSERYGLFPYDYAVKSKPKTLVLVEGPRDALRLLSKGIPTMAILGTQSWSPTKTKMLELSGIQRVILCMDGDPAGIHAIEQIEPKLKSMFKTQVFDLAGKDSPYWPIRNKVDPGKYAKANGIELWDPGNCPLNKIKELKKLIKEIE